MKSSGVERGQLTYVALILAAIDNDKPISEYLKGMEANNVGISEMQLVQILHCLAKANNTKLLSSVRITLSSKVVSSKLQISRSCVLSPSKTSVTRFEIC
jgi:hypothetical protein